MSIIETLEAIRDEYAHERNTWLYPPFGEAEKYARWRDIAQKKVDVLNFVIRRWESEAPADSRTGDMHCRGVPSSRPAPISLVELCNREFNRRYFEEHLAGDPLQRGALPAEPSQDVRFGT
jgi:hypothetical protein